MLRLLKRLFCKHEWKKLWMESFHYSGDKEVYCTEEIWYCECEKCGKHKFIVSENGGAFHAGGDEDGKG